MGEGDVGTSAKLPLPEELLYCGEVRQEELVVPLVFDCCLEWRISPLAGGRTGSTHSLTSDLKLGTEVESLELGSLSSRSA